LALAPHADGVYLDATFGAGGYSQMLLKTPDTRVIALDRDPLAQTFAAALQEQYPKRLALHTVCFDDLSSVIDAPLNGAVFDVGVSSMHLDDAARGFSFRFEAPLDMRMSQSGWSAADFLNTALEEELADVFYHYGEERYARRVARAVVEQRPLASTLVFAELCRKALPTVPPHKGGIHPATRVFQAVRIAINDELGQLVRALLAVEHALAVDGRLAVVSFHSLEDRIVKQFFTQRSKMDMGSRHAPHSVTTHPTFSLLQRKPILPSESEIAENPRARSAKLRAAIRLDTPAQTNNVSLLRLAYPTDRLRDLLEKNIEKDLSS
jgi:16S rRNA (cytosine1402-N4)-methyltransferase